jgi:hypothetical protein
MMLIAVGGAAAVGTKRAAFGYPYLGCWGLQLSSQLGKPVGTGGSSNSKTQAVPRSVQCAT